MISKQGAQQILQSQKPGTGLMRCTAKGKFILSYKNKNEEIVHTSMSKSLAEEKVHAKVRHLLNPANFVFDNFEIFKASLFDLGPLTSEEIENALQDKPAMQGLVHYDEQTDKFFLFFKDHDSAIKHHPLLPHSFEKVMQDYVLITRNEMDINEHAYLHASNYNFGPLPRQEATEVLKRAPIGTGVLRYSPSAKDFILSYKAQNNRIEHKTLHGNYLEDAANTANIHYLISLEEFDVRGDTALRDSPFNFGLFSTQQAQDLLEKSPPYTGLLRQSKSFKGFVLSYIDNKGMPHDEPLGNLSLADTRARYAIRNLLLAPKKRAAPAEPISEEELVAMEVKEELPVGKYDRQVILNLGTGNTAKGLNAKAATVKLPSEAIDLRNPESSLAPLSELTPNSRLYIIGHCTAGSDYINSKEGINKTVKDYVDMLLKQAPHLQETSKENRLKVSIIACFGGVDKRSHKSFGYQLSQALDKADIHAEVLARAGVSRGDADVGKKTVGGKHHEEQSKLSFVTEGGTTIVRSVSYT